VSNALADFEFGEAAKTVYDFFWDEFCDWYIELAKVRLRADDPAGQKSARTTLVNVAEQALRLLHPFMPFVTEELWQALSASGGSIMTSPWPDPAPAVDSEAEAAVNLAMAAIRTVRNLRAEINLPPATAVRLQFLADTDETLDAWRRMAPEIQVLLKASDLKMELRGSQERPKRAIFGVTEGGLAAILLDGVLDLDRERERLERSEQSTGQELARVRARLEDGQFVSRAPEAVVASSRAALQELEARLLRIRGRLEDL
jgi:valyl-tRNA synthetase